MQTFNNKGELIGEINTTITQEGSVVVTHTMYSVGRAIAQNISIRDVQGNVRTENVFGKLLP
jgi:hypothetical protein